MEDEPIVVIGGDTPEYCGGKKMPSDKGEGVGKWECIEGEWVWKREIGGV